MEPIRTFISVDLPRRIQKDIKKIQNNLPEKKENYATTFIFNDKIIIQMLHDKPFLIKIENKEIFEGYKQNFDLLWKNL